MPVAVNLQTVRPRKLAAVRCEVTPGAVGSAWRPALDKVWEFIRSQPGLRTDGRNIFLYGEPAQPGAPILCDFGVEVTRSFETAGEVYATETPAGEAATEIHRGPYDRANEAHDAIRKWMAANRREFACKLGLARFRRVVRHSSEGRIRLPGGDSRQLRKRGA